MNKAEELIACLEGEIAKRDERIVELQNDARYYAARNEELRAKLAAPVSEAKAQGVVMPEPDFWLDGGATPCYYAEPLRAALNAAPVSAGDDEFCDGNCTWLDHHPSCARAAAPAAPAADAPPESCRQRLASEGKPYPKSSCAACGQFSPKWRECDAALAAHRAKGVV